MLFRKVNTTAHGVHHRFGGDFRDDRRGEDVLKSGATRLGMHGEKRRGLDYTPLFRFLLSRVGKEWSEVHGKPYRVWIDLSRYSGWSLSALRTRRGTFAAANLVTSVVCGLMSTASCNA
jgi:hypothetical protein